MNRSLQALRADGVIGTSNSKVLIKAWEKLQEAAEFDPTYLHLRKQAA